jgi:AraC-like DNA-binding protein
MTDDPLSTVLSLIDARAVYTGGLVTGGDFAIRFPPPDKVKVFTLARGAVRLHLDGEAAPRQIQTGDVVLMAPRRGFVLAAGHPVPPVDAVEVFVGMTGRYTHGSGDDVLLLGSHIDVGAGGQALLDALPSMCHVVAAGDRAVALRALVDLMLREVDVGAAGSGQARTALAQLLFLETLRLTLADAEGLPPGWLRALGDPRLAPALKLMHADPARDWHLPDLARASGMSRTAFAVRFKAAAGQAPLAYLTEWRMRLAERALKRGTPIAELAASIGYASEAAFSTAFKRVAGMSPTMARRREASAEA